MASQNGRLLSQALVLFVHAPYDMGHPTKSAFDKSETEVWKPLENSFEDDRDQVCLIELGKAHMHLQVIRELSCCARSSACGGGRRSRVHVDGNSMPIGRFVDRPIMALTKWNSLGSTPKRYRLHLRMPCPSLDLSRREIWVLHRHLDCHLIAIVFR